MILLAASFFLAVSWWLLLRWTTGLDSLKAVLDRSAGHLLEIGLYKDEPRSMLASFSDLCGASLRVGQALLAPALLFVLPLLLILGPVSSCYQHRSLNVEESVLLWVQVPEGELDLVQLMLPPGVELESDPVRRGQGSRQAWRLRSTKPGTYQLGLKKAGEVLQKRLRVEQGLKPLASGRTKSWGHWLTEPTESVLEGEAWADSIQLDYPKREIWILDRPWPWWIFLLLGFLLAATMTRKIAE